MITQQFYTVNAKEISLRVKARPGARQDAVLGVRAGELVVAVLGPDGDVPAGQRVTHRGQADERRADDACHARLLSPGCNCRGQLSSVRGGGVHFPVGGNDQWSHDVNDDRARPTTRGRFGPSRRDPRRVAGESVGLARARTDRAATSPRYPACIRRCTSDIADCRFAASWAIWSNLCIERHKDNRSVILDGRNERPVHEKRTQELSKALPVPDVLLWCTPDARRPLRGLHRAARQPGRPAARPLVRFPTSSSG
jgi:hypothetical protein